jgi:hypothetical protein
VSDVGREEPMNSKISTRPIVVVVVYFSPLNGLSPTSEQRKVGKWRVTWGVNWLASSVPPDLRFASQNNGIIAKMQDNAEGQQQSRYKL